MDRERFRALSGIRRRSIQGILAALVQDAAQGLARRLLGHPRQALEKHLPQLLPAGPPRPARGFPHLRAVKDGARGPAPRPPRISDKSGPGTLVDSNCGFSRRGEVSLPPWSRRRGASTTPAAPRAPVGSP